MFRGNDPTKVYGFWYTNKSPGSPKRTSWWHRSTTQSQTQPPHGTQRSSTRRFWSVGPCQLSACQYRTIRSSTSWSYTSYPSRTSPDSSTDARLMISPIIFSTWRVSWSSQLIGQPTSSSGSSRSSIGSSRALLCPTSGGLGQSGVPTNCRSEPSIGGGLQAAPRESRRLPLE